MEIRDQLSIEVYSLNQKVRDLPAERLPEAKKLLEGLHRELDAMLEKR